MLASIIIRTLNEAIHLDELLSSIKEQETENLEVEIVLVDSGSTDNTLQIAQSHNCNIVHISQAEFSFGRSLNIGCDAASGEFLVITSGHCIPSNTKWLQKLCQPLIDNYAGYAYGRQIGGSESHYSECRLFAKYYPAQSQIPQEGFFCNNANAAIKRSVWDHYKFDEELTGLEDMRLAQDFVSDGGQLAYIADACVYHLHDENWSSIKRRFERESIALQKIMPQIQIRLPDLVRYIVSSIWLDWRAAAKDQVFINKAFEIIQYRFFQYWGSFVGNHDHRKLSHVQKEEYFYPKELRRKNEAENRRPVADEI